MNTVLWKYSGIPPSRTPGNWGDKEIEVSIVWDPWRYTGDGNTEELGLSVYEDLNDAKAAVEADAKAASSTTKWVWGNCGGNVHVLYGYKNDAQSPKACYGIMPYTVVPKSSD